MGSKRHPLDVFRSTDEGFVSASQQKRRRKITGKVLTSSSRPQSAPAVRAAPAAKATVAAASRSVPRISSATFDLLRKGGYALACLALVGVAVWSISTIWGGTVGGPAGDPTSLSVEARTEDVLGSGNADLSAPTLFTIRASNYPGTERAQEIALDARDKLIERGFPDVALLEWADERQAGVVDHYELIVGAARSADGLADLLRQLQAISDWPGGKPAPFTTAFISEHPVPALYDPSGR
ncbi:MAG: hypothetical protein H6825_15550 [Planctomycetes bacterium]|nr:hypothetical protein [Planctomycetota bacterium]